MVLCPAEAGPQFHSKGCHFRSAGCLFVEPSSLYRLDSFTSKLIGPWGISKPFSPLDRSWLRVVRFMVKP